jgi:cytochrome P450 family 307 subfamily A
MNDVGCSEIDEFMKRMKAIVKPEGEEIYLKPMIMETCANLFSLYMCSIRFDYNDARFNKMVRCFDEIFWEINQGYAVDFLPWLSPFYKSHMNNVESWAKSIREFILERVIDVRAEKLHERSEDDDDFTDALLRSLSKEENVTKNTIIFMLEDFLGGHSAIGRFKNGQRVFAFLTSFFMTGNLVYLALGYIALHPIIGKKIQDEIAQITENGKRKVSLHDTESMPFTVATIYEILRYSSSPIVPHVATENSQIGGYGVLKDTIVFINNYELNTSDKYWDNPKEFNPERFIETVPANKVRKDAPPNAPNVTRVKKNIPHYLPFSVGKRTCIGQNLVRCFSFLLLINILENFDVSTDDPDSIKMYPACVAVPPETYSLKLTPRK